MPEDNQQPQSFDCSSSDNIRRTANRHLGHCLRSERHLQIALELHFRHQPDDALPPRLH